MNIVLFFAFRSTFHRLVETADIISHLAKNTKSSSAKIKKPVVQQQQTTAIETSSSSNATKIQKFRTSSYVATAVVPSRKQRKSLTLQTPPLALPTPQKQLLNEQNTDSEQENTIKIPLRRTRSKSLKLFREVAARKCEKMS
jgi:hypothetical protein